MVLQHQVSFRLTDWVIASGKNLVSIYFTHSYDDHHFGSSTLLKHFPCAKVWEPKRLLPGWRTNTPPRDQGLWGKLFPGQIPAVFASAEALPRDESELEGGRLTVERLGHTDCDETTALWVPSAGLLVAVYGSTHPYTGESGTVEARLTWITALDKLDALKPVVVVGGHTNPNSPFGPDAISQTRTYLEDFNRTVEESQTAEEIYARMMDRYPSRLNPGSLWAGAALSKPK